MREVLALFRGQAHGVNEEGRRSAAAWVQRCIDGRVLEAVRERGQQVEVFVSFFLVLTRFTAWWGLVVSTLLCLNEGWRFLGVDTTLLGGWF